MKDRLSMKIFFVTSLLLPILLFGQESREGLRFVFYNVENLFDPFNDSLTADEEFLPGGVRGWRGWKSLLGAGAWWWTASG